VGKWGRSLKAVQLKSEKNPIGKSGSLSAINAITIDDIPNDRFFNAK
jgi:hypothetical protein